ncbi:MAG: tripartite tricarboxylate transporter substrate binding protein [Pigmentiphaga sp.]|uniref:Bug family tripartite tricarboxylate transporter substrate binding protein n=1 Tax=Pigmentiphaga sp. TaxID=1977564 RepID=UPI0029B3F9A3|nr:tripartite tricarboxylate transporter substrate binding protein [Pigmentiphaga sp.]MDX3907600.1 tripartite tricarboxylate transporter substrate binding protein [Pigmentiphaga sp.]
MKKWYGCIIGAFAATALAPAVHAQDYPSKMIRIVVPFPPGGSTDLLARQLAEKLAQSLGQTVIVENRPGAGGTVGSAYVARAAADGYTLLMGVTGSHGVSYSLYSKPPYDPVKDFAPVSMVVNSPLILVRTPDVPAKTVQEFVAYAKAHPGKLTYGSPGNGTSMHLTGEMFSQATGVSLLHVPYKGSAGVLNDLLGGQLQSAFADLLVVQQFIKSGKLQPVAVTSSKRHPMFPDVPTIAESGVPNFEALSWQGLFAPAGTPPEVVNKLNGAVVKVLERQDMKDFFASQGFIVAPTSPEQFGQFVAAEVKKWGAIVKTAGVQIE